MNACVYCFICILFLIQISDNFAMQPLLTHQNSSKTSTSKIICLDLLDRKTIAITSTKKDVINIVGSDFYISCKWKEDKVTAEIQPIMIEEQKICFHSEKNKALFFSGNQFNDESKNNAYFINYEGEVVGKAFDYPTYSISSGLFSKEEPVIFLLSGKKFIFYDYEKDTISFRFLKKQLGTIFSYPSHNQSYFLCTNHLQKSIYKIIPEGDHCIEKKICKFSFKIDPMSFVYSSEKGLFFCINKSNRMLYVVDIKGKKKLKKYREKKYQFGDVFSVATMLLHPNKKILALFSEKTDLIQYLDIKNYKNIRHVLTTYHSCLGTGVYDMYSSQKVAFSPKGRDLFIAIEKKCFVMKVPSFVSDIDTYAKFCMVRYFNFPAELRNFIEIFLLRVNECFTES
jgi:hypothetical protein